MHHSSQEAHKMTLSITPIEAENNHAIANVIRQVGAEFGAIGDGFGPSDAEVDAMSEHYLAENRSVYFVAKVAGKVVGGCGLAPFESSSADTCELKKLFILPEYRALGLGRKLTVMCLEFAKQQGYQDCYLDTLSSMSSAIQLYQKFGFEHLDKPMEGTLHNGCDVWMKKTF